jgi:hypothetical protein
MDIKRTQELRLLRNTVLTITCIVLALFPAYGQDNRKNEIGLLLGGTFTPALDVAGPGASRLEIGSGITFQLTYARQLTAARSMALYFEVPALAIPLQDITSSNGTVPRNYDSFFVTPGLKVKLARLNACRRGFPQVAVTLFSTRARTGWTEHTTPREERAGAHYSSAEVSISAHPSKCCFRSV